MNERRKIALLTLPIKENYGGVIQIAALYHYLESKGYDPYLIRKKYDESLPKRIFRYLLSHNPLFFIYDYNNLTKREKQSAKLTAFIDSFFVRRTKAIYNRNDYMKIMKDFGVVIVGSDQVWRYKYVKENYRYYFLDYLSESTKKIAYAASFGVENWEGNNETISIIQKKLSEFDAVSVREDSGVQICSNTFKKDNVLHVLDPTFLPDVSFYHAIIERDKPSYKVNLFSYVLDNAPHVKEIIEYVSNKTSLEVNTIKLTEYQNRVNPSLSEWLYNFREAEFVVTDSFHGMIFSMLFSKQFVCICNKNRGYTRFKSILEVLGLEDRLVFDFDEQTLSSLLQTRINYDVIREKINTYKGLSEKYLLENLK